METVMVVCVGAGLNLALWGALYHKVGGLPEAFLAGARRERSEGERRAMAVLQEAAAAKVGALSMSLRALEEQAAARHRDEVAAVEVRARVAERRASETLPALGAALDLVHELRSMLDAMIGAAPGAHPAERVTPVLDPSAQSQRTLLPPLPDAEQRDAETVGAS